MSLHTEANLTAKGYNAQTRRLFFTIPSASRPDHEHHFTVGLDGSAARCTCYSFVQRGWCTLTRHAEEIAHNALVARYEGSSATELASRYGELLGAYLGGTLAAEEAPLYEAIAEAVERRRERAVAPRKVRVLRAA